MFTKRTLIPSLPASDINRARQFYADKLDLKPSEDRGDGGLRYDAGDSWFMLYPSAFAGTNQATAAAWQVDDLRATVTALQGRGVTFQEYDLPDFTTDNGIATAPDGTLAAWFSDSEGNIIGLFQET